MITDQSYGIIPFVIEEKTPVYLLVHHEEGHWAFPKGHPEKEETPIETAKRELKEETNLEVAKLYQEPVLIEQYWYTNFQKQKVSKQVGFYIGMVSNKQVVVQPEEIIGYAWLNYDEALKQMSFPQGKKVLTQAHEFLQKQQ